MSSLARDNSGAATIEFLVVVIATAGLGLAGYALYKRWSKKNGDNGDNGDNGGNGDNGEPDS